MTSHRFCLRSFATTCNTGPSRRCGEFFFLAQLVLLPALAVASLAHLFAPLVIVAFVPAVVRGSQWFFRKPQPLDVKRLGWSEMKHGVAFGVLLAIALLYR
jgi:hypothetical protein